MGGGTSSNIEYNSFTSEEQLKILDDFKVTYADKSKTKLPLIKISPYEYIIYSNNYKIKFKHEADLIEFVCEIGRPFVITYLDSISTYSIHFVYGKI
jgi:hypothetical protein